MDSHITLTKWRGQTMLNHAATALAEAASQRGAGSAVRLDNVTQRYGRGQSEVVALDRLSLEIAEGEFLAIMGPSGSGKSTLLNLIGALDRPTEGRILIGDREDRKSTRLNSSHVSISYAVFCLKKK